MPDIYAEIDFLARLDLYANERPYIMLLGVEDEIDDDVPITNLQFETKSKILIQDMREHPELNFSQCGFEFLRDHQSRVTVFETEGDIMLYKRETEALLSSHFDAVKALTYEVKLRKNIHFERTEYDANDELVIEGPATGAHNGTNKPDSRFYQADLADLTYESGFKMVWHRLQPEDRAKYLRPGYRIRVIK